MYNLSISIILGIKHIVWFEVKNENIVISVIYYLPRTSFVDARYLLVQTQIHTKVYPWWQIAQSIFVRIISGAAKVFESFFAERIQHIQSCSGSWLGPFHWWNSLIHLKACICCIPINRLKKKVLLSVDWKVKNLIYFNMYNQK